jgi:hypothetical protein
VPAQLPQVHQSHQQQLQQPQQQSAQRRRSSNQEQRRPSSSSSSGGGARRGRPRTQQPEPVNEEQVGLSGEQRSAIQRYIDLDDQISQLNNQLKVLRNERKELEDNVLAILRPLRSASVRTRDNVVLRAKKKKKKENLNQKVWARKLAESGQLKNPDSATALVKNIYKNLETTEDYELVRE